MSMIALLQTATDMAATAKAASGGNALLGAGLGAGLATIGAGIGVQRRRPHPGGHGGDRAAHFRAGIGIGQAAKGAAEGMARQPEAAGQIQSAAIILAALVEGVALFAVVVTLLVTLKF